MRDGDGGELVPVVGVPDELAGRLQHAHDVHRRVAGQNQVGHQGVHARIVENDVAGTRVRYWQRERAGQRRQGVHQCSLVV